MYRLLLHGSEKRSESSCYVDSVQCCGELVVLIRAVWQKDVVFFSILGGGVVLFIFVIADADLEGVFLLSRSVDFRRAAWELGRDVCRIKSYQTTRIIAGTISKLNEKYRVLEVAQIVLTSVSWSLDQSDVLIVDRIPGTLNGF